MVKKFFRLRATFLGFRSQTKTRFHVIKILRSIVTMDLKSVYLCTCMEIRILYKLNFLIHITAQRNCLISVCGCLSYILNNLIRMNNDSAFLSSKVKCLSIIQSLHSLEILPQFISCKKITGANEEEKAKRAFSPSLLPA